MCMKVLSTSVAQGLHYLREEGISSEDTVETQRFVQLFDKFFDCLNVRYTR